MRYAWFIHTLNWDRCIIDMKVPGDKTKSWSLPNGSNGPRDRYKWEMSHVDDMTDIDRWVDYVKEQCNVYRNCSVISIKLDWDRSIIDVKVPGENTRRWSLPTNISICSKYLNV